MADKKVSSFIKMRQANAKFCEKGTEGSKSTLDKSITRYMDDAVKGGKTKTEAKANVRKFTGCSMKKKK
jgi:hypothetical protein